jgi:hypothetical protein
MKSSAGGGFEKSQNSFDTHKHLKLQTKFSFMKRPYSLLLSALAIGFLFSSSSEAPAFGGPPGGPFSNGSYFPNDGTFSAVVRGENLTGTLQFSTSSNASSTGVASIYFDGDTYQGNSQGALNPKASTMTVNFQADVTGQGQNTIEVQTPVTTQVTTLVQNPVTGVVTPVQTEQTEFQVTREILYFDSLFLNGAANCKTSNALPNQKFEGTGEAEFQQLVFTGNTPFMDAVTIPISVTGVRLSNAATAFINSEVQPPSVNEFSVLVP